MKWYCTLDLDREATYGAPAVSKQIHFTLLDRLSGKFGMRPLFHVQETVEHEIPPDCFPELGARRDNRLRLTYRQVPKLRTLYARRIVVKPIPVQNGEVELVLLAEGLSEITVPKLHCSNGYSWEDELVRLLVGTSDFLR